MCLKLNSWSHFIHLSKSALYSFSPLTEHHQCLSPKPTHHRWHLFLTTQFNESFWLKLKSSLDLYHYHYHYLKLECLLLFPKVDYCNSLSLVFCLEWIFWSTTRKAPITTWNKTLQILLTVPRIKSKFLRWGRVWVEVVEDIRGINGDG